MRHVLDHSRSFRRRRTQYVALKHRSTKGKLRSLHDFEMFTAHSFLTYQWWLHLKLQNLKKARQRPFLAGQNQVDSSEATERKVDEISASSTPNSGNRICNWHWCRRWLSLLYSTARQRGRKANGDWILVPVFERFEAVKRHHTPRMSCGALSCTAMRSLWLGQPSYPQDRSLRAEMGLWLELEQKNTGEKADSPDEAPVWHFTMWRKRLPNSKRTARLTARTRWDEAIADFIPAQCIVLDNNESCLISQDEKN